MPAGGGEIIVVIHRAQFVEQRIAIGDGARQRRLDEGKVLDLAKMQRLHAQDHRRERRAQNFRVGVGGAGVVVRFVIEPDAHAARDAAATAGALAGRSLGDLFDLQLLDLAAIAVALDPRLPDVDHIAYPRDRQGGFRYVGGQHDTPAGMRAKHPILLGGGES